MISYEQWMRAKEEERYGMYLQQQKEIEEVRQIAKGYADTSIAERSAVERLQTLFSEIESGLQNVKTELGDVKLSLEATAKQLKEHDAVQGWCPHEGAL